MSPKRNPPAAASGPGTSSQPAPYDDAPSAELEPQRVAMVGVVGDLDRGLRQILAAERCAVVVPPDVPTLIRQVADHAIDLAIVDTDSLGADPGQLTRAVKAASAQTIVMLLSAGSSAGPLVDAIRAGAYDLFLKPVSSDELRNRLHHALENQRLGQTIRRRSRQLAFVNEISNAISASLDLRQVLQTAASAIRALIDFDLAAAALRHASQPSITLYPLTPAAEALWADQPTLAVADTVLGDLLEDCQPRLHADLAAEPPPAGLRDLCEDHYRSLVLLPLVSKGRAIGAFLLASRQPGAFAPRHLQALHHVGGHLATALENAQLYEQLKTLSSHLEQTVQQRSREVFEVKQYLENLVETAGDAVIAADLDGHVTSWNKAAEEILGYAKDEVLGTDVCALASGDGARDQALAILASARAGQTTSDAETLWLRKDRKDATVTLTVSPITDSARRTAGILIIARDITDRKKLQEELFHSEKLASIGQLAAGVAHQINNPLGAISGRTQMLLRFQGPCDEEFLRTQLGKIQADCARINETINDLLGFARKTETVKQYADVNTIVDETLEMVKHEIIAHKVHVERNLAENLPPVVASANHLRQLFANLMTNAFDAMDTGGVLTITSVFRPLGRDNPDQVVEIAFADTGVGIPQEEIASIFEPFYTTKPAGQGTGLGLAVAKRIVDFHNGRIDITSRVGTGTTFVVQFPVE